jgi:hypothetical protein
MRPNYVVARRRSAAELCTDLAERATRVVVTTATFTAFVYVCWLYITSSS